MTRIYFSDEAAANDTVLNSIQDVGRRDTLVAVRRRDDAEAPVYEFDAHLQAPQEIVFFEV